MMRYIEQWNADDAEWADLKGLKNKMEEKRR